MAIKLFDEDTSFAYAGRSWRVETVSEAVQFRSYAPNNEKAASRWGLKLAKVGAGKRAAFAVIREFRGNVRITLETEKDKAHKQFHDEIFRTRREIESSNTPAKIRHVGLDRTTVNLFRKF